MVQKGLVQQHLLFEIGTLLVHTVQMAHSKKFVPLPLCMDARVGSPQQKSRSVGPMPVGPMRALLLHPTFRGKGYPK